MINRGIMTLGEHLIHRVIDGEVLTLNVRDASEKFKENLNKLANDYGVKLTMTDDQAKLELYEERA